MKHGISALILAATIAAAAPATAGDFTVGDLTISNPWARASAGKANNGAAYLMQIVNNGHDVDRLIAVATPAAKTAELHNHIMEDGIMKMRPVKAIEVNPGEPSMLKPGGLHIMMMNLQKPLTPGETFPMTLTFEKAGKIEVPVTVMEVGSMGYSPTGQGANPCMDHNRMHEMMHGPKH